MGEKCQQKKKLDDLDFADDVSLLSHIVDLCRLRLRDCNIARTAGLESNVTKTKNMKINASQEAPSLLMT